MGVFAINLLFNVDLLCLRQMGAALKKRPVFGNFPDNLFVFGAFSNVFLSDC